MLRYARLLKFDLALPNGQIHRAYCRGLHAEEHSKQGSHSGYIWTVSAGPHVTAGPPITIPACCREASIYLMKGLNRINSGHFSGVSYYDSVERSWMILELDGRFLPRHASPVAEKATFVLYDEARCRGADLQLRPEAVGLLTLGPATCKDQMMQAAGRLRMFGRGQKLHIVASGDVTAKIRTMNSLQPSAVPTPVHVLQWVVRNTKQATQHGRPEWAKQGMLFASTLGLPDAVLQDEVMDVREMYTQKRSPQPVPQLVRAMKRRIQEVLLGDTPVAKRRRQIVEQIVSSCSEHGDGYSVVAGGGADEECERELEKEEEEEEEEERQAARMKPAQEVDWEYRSILGAASPRTLPSAAGVVPLQQLADGLQPADLGRIDWPPHLHVTASFMCTIDGGGLPSQGEYLRPVKALLLFPDGAALLVSEREADAILELLWADGKVSLSRGGVSRAPLLLGLSYAQKGYKELARGRSPPSLSLAVSVSSGGAWAAPDAEEALRRLGVSNLVAMHLFGGGTKYGTQAEMQELHRLMRRRLPAAEALTEARGRQSMLSRSGLERACEDVLLPEAVA